MSDWTTADLDRIGKVAELEITTQRADGSLRPYVPVWVVRVNDELFARSWRGQAGAWYRHSRQRPEGRIRAGGAEREVTRTAWHTHDGGQTLHGTEGRGLVQARGQQPVELRPGDVIYAPDREEHWHGATPDDFMTHLSITEGAPHWGDHVTDDEYQRQHTRPAED